MSSIPGAYHRSRATPSGSVEDVIVYPEQGPDMSQVSQEMPSMEEYKRWEEAFTAHLGFTTPEFNFKLMRFIGASRNMIDELRDMLQDQGTREKWAEFVKHQHDHKLILQALSAVASEGHRPDRPDTSRWQWRKLQPEEPEKTRRKKKTRKTRISRKKKVKRKQRWTAHKST